MELIGAEDGLLTRDALSDGAQRKIAITNQVLHSRRVPVGHVTGAAGTYDDLWTKKVCSTFRYQFWYQYSFNVD